MTHPHEQKRRDLHRIARRSADQPSVAKRYAEMMIAQIDSRRSPFPFIDQLPRVEKLFAHKMTEGSFPDLPADSIARAWGFDRNDQRGGFEALVEDDRLFELYPDALVAEARQEPPD